MADPAQLPLYEQARESIRERIALGEYGPGDRLPSESALATALGIHRLTARRALEELVREGVVVARKGSGTFVAPRRVPLPISVPFQPSVFAASLQRQLEAAGREFGEVLLGFERAERNADADRELRAGGRPLTRVRSALRVDGEFWVYSEYWIGPARLRGIRRAWRESDGLYGIALEQVGEMVSLWRAFRAEPATAAVADALGIRPGAPVMVREGVNTDVSGGPVIFLRRYARGDRVSYVIRYADPSS